MVGLGGAWGLGTSPGRAGSGCYAALGVAAPGFWLGGVGVIHGDPASLHGSDCCGEAVVKSWGSCPVIGLWPVKPEQAGSMVWGETCPYPGWAVEVITCLWLLQSPAGPGLVEGWDGSWGVQLLRMKQCLSQAIACTDLRLLSAGAGCRVGCLGVQLAVISSPHLSSFPQNVSHFVFCSFYSPPASLLSRPVCTRCGYLLDVACGWGVWALLMGKRWASPFLKTGLGNGITGEVQRLVPCLRVPRYHAFL